MDLLIRLYRLVVIWLRFRFASKKLPPIRTTEERLREIDDEFANESEAWSRELRGGKQFLLPPPAAVAPFVLREDRRIAPSFTRVNRECRSMSLHPSVTAGYNGLIPNGWHRVPNTSRWEPDTEALKSSGIAGFVEPACGPPCS